MPVLSVLQQPPANSIQAAYRPVVFYVEAQATDGTAEPPVVYCDIYFNGTFYKTLAKTQFYTLGETTSTWLFDIQDACQEVLSKKLGTNGGSLIIRPSEPMSTVYCRFRASTNDGSGFVIIETDIPVQATGKTQAVAGSGLESNTFYVLNATLQHEHNQDLATHLGYYKTGTWDAAAFPLTHRLPFYRISEGDSDYFPFVYLGNNTVRCLKLTVKKKDGTQQAYTYCEPLPPCVLSVSNVKIAKESVHGDGRTYYNATFKINGAADHYKVEIHDEDGNWIDITIDADYNVTITGTTVNYNAATDGSPADHSIRITPYCDDTRTGVAGTASYVVPVCPTVIGLSISYNSTSQQLTYSFTDPTNSPQTVQLYKDGVPVDITRTNAPSTGTFTITQAGDYYVDVTTACTVGDPITEQSNTITVTIDNPICNAPYNVILNFTPDGNSLKATWQVADNTYNDLVKWYDADTNTLLLQGTVSPGVNQAVISVAGVPNVQRFYCTVQHQCPVASVLGISGVVQRDNTYTLVLDYTTDPQTVKVLCYHYGQLAPAPFNVTINITLEYTIGGGSHPPVTGSNVLQQGNTSQYIYGSSGIVIVSAEITSINPASQGGKTYIY